MQGYVEICLRQLGASVQVLDVTNCELLLPFPDSKNRGKIPSERVFSISSFLSHFDCTMNDVVEFTCY